MDLKIESKHYTLIALIIVSFALGIMIVYVVHQTGTVEQTHAETPASTQPAEVITVTPTPASAPTVIETAPPLPPETPPAVTQPKQPDFTVKNYEPGKDKTTKTIEFKNNRAQPESISIKPGNSVLFTITDYTLQSSLTLILNSSYEKNLGKSGGVVVIFNNKGIYTFKAIIPSGDPHILPREYAAGTITVWTVSQE